jgi:hypothetical protein
VDVGDGTTWRAARQCRAAAKTVRVRRRQLLLTDGPFAETKEQIGGLTIIECADMDEAVEIAAAHPAASYGTIEIRPML